MLQKVELYANVKEMAKASHLFGQKFSTVCPFVNRSNYAYAFRKCLWLIQSEFCRPKFCRIVQILTGTEIS